MRDKQNIIKEWHFIAIHAKPLLVFPLDGTMHTGCSLKRNKQMSLKGKEENVMAGWRRREENREIQTEGERKSAVEKRHRSLTSTSFRPSFSIPPSLRPADRNTLTETRSP